MKRSIFLGFFLLLGLAACKKNSDDVLTQETAIVNSTVAPTTLSGEFPAVYIKWYGQHTPTLEGQDWAEVPDAKFISGNYKLIVEPSGPDSVKLYVDGSGSGPTFQKTFLGRFNCVAYQEPQKTVSYWRYKVWHLADQYSINKQGTFINRVWVDRYAYADRTVYNYHVEIAQITGDNQADKGQYIPYVPDRSNNEINLGMFQFTRRSTGILN